MTRTDVLFSLASKAPRRIILSRFFLNWVLVLPLFIQFSFMSHASEITGLSSSVTAVAFSPDGKTLAAADGSFDLTLWEVATGKLRSKLTGLATGTERVCWSPDGKTVYGTTGNDWIAWDAVTGKEKQKIKGEMSGTSPNRIALAPDGKSLAAAGRGKVKFWETASGKVTGEYEAHPNYAINSLAFSPDGKSVATTSNDKTAQTTRLSDGAGMTFTCPSRVIAAEFSPDKKSLFVVDEQPALHCFDLKTGEDTPAAPMPRAPKQMAVSPDGKLVACIGSVLRLWSVGDKCWYETKIVTSGADATSVAFSRDGKYVACGDYEKIQIFPTKELLTSKSP